MTSLLEWPNLWCVDRAVVDAEIPRGVFVAFGCRDGKQADTWLGSAEVAARTTREGLVRWQPVLADPGGPTKIEARRAGVSVVMGVALAHVWSAAWSTTIPTVDASPGSGCGTSGRCDPAIFQASAKTTPTSTGPTVEASPVRPRAQRRPRGLDP
jgi:hypothetical protein